MAVRMFQIRELHLIVTRIEETFDRRRKFVDKKAKTETKFLAAKEGMTMIIVDTKTRIRAFSEKLLI